LLFVSQVQVLRADGDLTVKLKLHSLKIKDELQSRLSVAPCYLAVSVLTNETSSSDMFDSHGKEFFHDDDDCFTDALSDFIAQTDGGHGLHNMDLDHKGLVGVASDFESLESILHETDIELIRGTPRTPREIYYEAQGSDTSNFVSVSFITRSSASPDYDGIDTQVRGCTLLMMTWSFWSSLNHDTF